MKRKETINMTEFEKSRVRDIVLGMTLEEKAVALESLLNDKETKDNYETIRINGNEVRLIPV